MIISHKYKFIFIKTMKTAGTSIEVFLSDHCGSEDVVTPVYPHIEPHVARNYEESGFFNHMSALEVKKRVSSEIWDSYYKFCVERNPWDKTLSHYYMVNYREGGSLSLDEYLSRGQFCINYPKYTDPAGNIIVDKIIKYETLIDELENVFGRFGIPFQGSLAVNAKSEYRDDRRSYRDVLSSHQASVISDIYSREILMHGYEY